MVSGPGGGWLSWKPWQSAAQPPAGQAQGEGATADPVGEARDSLGRKSHRMELQQSSPSWKPAGRGGRAGKAGRTGPCHHTHCILHLSRPTASSLLTHRPLQGKQEAGPQGPRPPPGGTHSQAAGAVTKATRQSHLGEKGSHFHRGPSCQDRSCPGHAFWARSHFMGAQSSGSHPESAGLLVQRQALQCTQGSTCAGAVLL